MATTQQVNSFIQKLSALAMNEKSKRQASGKKWTLPSLCIAQAALETGWGTSPLMVKANAYFGIKAGTNWKGKVYDTKTQECYDGVNHVTITDTFRAYDSLKESVTDYFDLITGLSRYNAACNTTDAKKCIQAIKDGGYATSPTYVNNVMSIINQYNLTQYDKTVSTTSTSSTKVTIEKAINTIIKVAEAEIDYLEKASNSQLDSKTANAGQNNYTKYWRDVYPSYQGQPWCACFVSWIFMKAFGLETAKKLLKHWPYVYCPTLGSLFTKYANPEVGDIVIFYRNGTFAHTGIVVKVSGDYFETIEGNTSGGSTIIANGGGVCRKSYYNSNLPGTKFCRPDYSLVTSINNANQFTSTTSTKSYLSLGDKGSEVKSLQQKLNKLGYKGADGNSLTEDGQFGNNTDYAVRAFQTDAKIEIDGKAGKGTMNAINSRIEALQKPTKPSVPTTSTPSTQLIKDAQIHLNNFTGSKLAIDGKYGAKTKKAFISAIQIALNKDYKYNFSCKGVWGDKTELALSKSILKKGSTGYLVTVVEIAMLLNNINPNGVECPGIMGNELVSAVKQYQKNKGLVQDGIVGINTWKSLCK